MALSLSSWLDKIEPLQKFSDKHIGEYYTKNFMVDPNRSIYQNINQFHSPADGIILYQKILKPDQKLAEVKGINYTLTDITGDNTFDKTCLVIGIFMTFFHCHINRFPGGYLTFKQLAPIMSYNRPMIFVENDLLDARIKNVYKNMTYLKSNARMLNTIHNPKLDYTYYVTQIADDEVNVITHFTTLQNQWFNQSERFSFIRWGSQVELILPLDPRFKFKTLIPNHFAVECCNDPLVQII